MNTWSKVARFHLTTRTWEYVTPLWILPAFVFLIVRIIYPAIYKTSAVMSQHPDPAPLVAMCILFAISGLLSVMRSLPFLLALGVGRRTYYIGTALLAVGLAVVNAALLVGVQWVEQATHGWGIGLHAFRQPWIAAGPGFQSWWTFWVAIALSFVIGMWYGLVYLRWSLIGLIAFGALQIIVVSAAIVTLTKLHAWHSVWHFMAGLGAGGLTDLLAILALVLFAGGLTTLRRATV